MHSNLYKSELPDDVTHIDNFLSTIKLSKINDEDRKNLDLPFTQAEINKALNSLKSNKAPGEGGFPPEFYKKFKDLLIPLIKDVINLSFKMHSLPESFRTAIITRKIKTH